MTILPSWHIFPPLVQFDNVAPNTEVSTEVGLYCGADLPFEGLAAPVVTPSGDVKVEWLDNPTIQPLPMSVDIHGAPAARRRVMRIAMKSGSIGQSLGARVELVPVGASSPVTSVAITCRTAPEEYELIPPVLVIPADANDEQVHRVVRCRINRGAKGPLYISSCPEHVRAKLREVDSNNWDIDIEVRPSDAEATTRIEFSAGIDKRPACTLLLKSVGSSKP